MAHDVEGLVVVLGEKSKVEELPAPPLGHPGREALLLRALLPLLRQLVLLPREEHPELPGVLRVRQVEDALAQDVSLTDLGESGDVAGDVVHHAVLGHDDEEALQVLRIRRALTVI